MSQKQNKEIKAKQNNKKLERSSDNNNSNNNNKYFNIPEERGPNFLNVLETVVTVRHQAPVGRTESVSLALEGPTVTSRDLVFF